MGRFKGAARMTIPSTPRKAGPLLGTGAQTAWPFTFKVFSESDISVTIADSLGVETTLVLNTDYSVALNSNQDTSPGGTVTYPISGTPLAVGSVLLMVGDIAYDQPLDLPAGGNFSPLALENQLDRQVMHIQQLAEKDSRALKIPVSSTASADLPAPEAGTLLGWNATGDALISVPSSSAVATDLAVTSAAESAASAAASEVSRLASGVSADESAASAAASEVSNLASGVAQVAAESAQTAAEAARDAAIIQAGVYATEVAGRAAVADGVAFKVQGSGDVAAYEYRRVDASSSVLIATYPSSQAVADLSATLNSSLAVEGYVFTLADGIGRSCFAITEAGLVKMTDAIITNLAVSTLSVGANSFGSDLPLDFVWGVLDSSYRLAIGVKRDGTFSFGSGAASALSLVSMAAQTLTLDDTVFSSDVPRETIFSLMDGLGRAAIALQSDGSLAVTSLTVASLNGVTASAMAALYSENTYRGNYQAEITHIMSYGQSLSMGAHAYPALTTTQQFDSLMFSDGLRTSPTGHGGTPALYASLVPLIEAPDPTYGATFTETPVGGMFEQIKTLVELENGLSYSQQSWQLLGSSPGANGETIAHLSKGNPAARYPILVADVTNGYALAQAAGKSYVVSAVTLTEGESDQYQGLSGATYMASMTQLLSDINSDVKSITGQTDDVVMIGDQIATHKVQVGNNFPTIALAQLAQHEAASGFYLACPMYMMPYYPTDNLHLTNLASKWLGAYYGIAYKRLVVDGLPFDIVRPLSMLTQGKIITVKFSVPSAPLVLDTTQVALNTNYGFELVDSGGAALTISSVALTEPDTIKIVAAATVPSGAKLRYAFSGSGVSGPVTGPRGNLRDSQGDSIVFDQTGINARMDNWCALFEKTL
jgi:hypothetical protein